MYCYKTIELLKDGHDKAIEFLKNKIRSGQIGFPYQKYFITDPDPLFQNLQNNQLQPIVGPYRLRSYYPKFGLYTTYSFRNTHIRLQWHKDNYFKCDVLSDLFIEEQRMKARRNDQSKPIIEEWLEDHTLDMILNRVLQHETIDPKTLRDAIYRCIPETKVFSPTVARGVLKLVFGDTDLTGKKMLDISAGWGDRLLTAMSLGMDYQGYDPNIDLAEGHTQMIRRFGNPDKHKIAYQPFEQSEIKQNYYDVVLSSPPFYDLEIYSGGQDGQSIESYPNFNVWMARFLFASLKKSWDGLKEDGYLILHLNDTKTINMCEATNLFVEKVLGGTWEGVIGFEAKTFGRPIWVWKKSAVQRLWIDNYGGTDRSLATLYPDLLKEYINYKNNINIDPYLTNIRHEIIKRLPSKFPLMAISILSDELLREKIITTGPELTISWAVQTLLSFA